MQREGEEIAGTAAGGGGGVGDRGELGVKGKGLVGEGLLGSATLADTLPGEVVDGRRSRVADS